MTSGARILIVDADRAARRAIRAALADRGHAFAGAASESAALRAVRGRRPDLALVDPRLPDGDGLRLVRALRPTPLILLGAPLDGGDLFHAKPVDPWRLTFQVFRALRGAAPREPAPSPGLRGSLSLMGLAALLNHLEAERATGRLTLTSDAFAGRAVLECRDGKLLRARLDGPSSPSDAELVYALLPLVSGSFEFRPFPIDGADAIGVSVAALLLEGARREDEAAGPSGSNPDRPSRTESGSPGGSTI